MLNLNIKDRNDDLSFLTVFTYIFEQIKLLRQIEEVRRRVTYLVSIQLGSTGVDQGGKYGDFMKV